MSIISTILHNFFMVSNKMLFRTFITFFFFSFSSKWAFFSPCASLKADLFLGQIWRVRRDLFRDEKKEENEESELVAPGFKTSRHWSKSYVFLFYDNDTSEMFFTFFPSLNGFPDEGKKRNLFSFLNFWTVCQLSESRLSRPLSFSNIWWTFYTGAS